MSCMNPLTQGFTVSAAIAVALVAGTLFAFSTFIMRAFDTLPADQAIRAMQAINVSIVRSLFIASFVGAAALLLGALVVAFASGASGTPRLSLGLALGFYVVGVIVVTGTQNIPLNDALATFSSGDAASAWKSYFGAWLAWNHVRTAGSIASLLALLSALVFRGGR